MPAYNSEDVIGMALESIRKQNIDQDNVEILVIDGGSEDKTVEIAKSFGAKILLNEKRLPEFAKKIGFENASGKYCMFLDTDEILVSKECFSRRSKVFEKYDYIHVISSTGGPAPRNLNGAARYATRVGDPFSSFVYHFYNGANYLETMTKQFKCHRIEEDGWEFDYTDAEYLPLFDGQGLCVRTDFARQIKERYDILDITTDIFCNIAEITKTSVVLEEDFICHHQKTSFKKLMNKLKWRIKNNLFQDECVGFSSREKKQEHINFRKYLFLPYCLLIIPVIINAIRLVVTEKDLYFLMDIVYTEAVFIMICWYVMLKILHIPVREEKKYG